MLYFDPLERHGGGAARGNWIIFIIAYAFGQAHNVPSLRKTGLGWTELGCGIGVWYPQDSQNSKGRLSQKTQEP